MKSVLLKDILTNNSFYLSHSEDWDLPPDERNEWLLLASNECDLLIETLYYYATSNNINLHTDYLCIPNIITNMISGITYPDDDWNGGETRMFVLSVTEKAFIDGGGTVFIALPIDNRSLWCMVEPDKITLISTDGIDGLVMKLIYTYMADKRINNYMAADLIKNALINAKSAKEFEDSVRQSVELITL